MKHRSGNALLAVVVLSLSACTGAPRTHGTERSAGEHIRADAAPTAASAASAIDRQRQEERDRMVSSQLASRGIADASVLRAMAAVPRHAFVAPSMAAQAYDDHPLPIGHGQTISQPFIVAYMTEALALEPDDRVLEIGTGSGYQTAVLAEVGARVFSVEIVCELADSARALLVRLGYGARVTVLCADGYAGWAEHAPFDAIVVTAAPPEIPRALVEQLRPGGRLVVPVGTHWQELRVIEKAEDGHTSTRAALPVRFVPMVRGAGAQAAPE